MSARVFVDTNVLVYAFDDSEPTKQAKAQEVLARREGGDFVVSTQVLQELYVALTRGPDPIRAPPEAEEAVRQAAKLIVVQIDPPLVLGAITRHRQHRVSFWDALVIQAAEAAGCARLLSEDMNDGQAFGSVRLENPFATTEPMPAPAKPRAPRSKRPRH